MWQHVFSHQSGNPEPEDSCPASGEKLAFGHTFSTQIGVYYHMPHITRQPKDDMVC